MTAILKIQPDTGIDIRRLDFHIHPFADLCAISARDIYDRYIAQQHLEFTRAFEQLAGGRADAVAALPMLADVPLDAPEFGYVASLDSGAVCAIFEDLHRHVLGHPVWIHPFFERFARGDFTQAQFVAFGGHYLNQIKNTRQCVALALGRLHSLALEDMTYAHERIGEQSQVVLAGILADEYGVAAHPTTGHGDAALPTDLCWATTHVDLFRRLLALVDVPVGTQDRPMLPQVADNVLIQRGVASDPGYDMLEALASVGMAMEWGVPIIFSHLLRGVLVFGERTGLAITPYDVEVLSGHVTQDVEHAIGVMLAALLWLRSPDDLARVKQTTSLVMAGRYQMMSAIYEAVFDEPCAALDTAMLSPAHHLHDRRALDMIARMRATANPAMVDHRDYRSAPIVLPFVA